MAKETNPRARKLDAISTKIAMFAMQETFSDEREAQQLLNAAIVKLDAAKELLKTSDLANEGK